MLTQSFFKKKIRWVFTVGVIKYMKNKNILTIWIHLFSSSPEPCDLIFYPTALKGCQGIVLTHGVRMGSRAGGGKKFVRAVSQKL